jgi:hypothetical protein
MSKNQDRYKKDYAEIDTEELEEMETKKFEKFHPKKKQVSGAKIDISEKSIRQEGFPRADMSAM